MTKNKIKWVVLGIIALLLVAGAARTLVARKAAREALQAQPEAQKTQTVVELLASDTVRVQNTTLRLVLDVSGPLKAVNTAIVKARVAGELQGLTVREGDVVRAGQVLARVDSTEFAARVRQAQQQAESTKAQVDIARRSFDNNQSLVNQGFISRTALDTSLATLASAEANYRAALAGAEVATKSLDDTVLRAPITGVVAQRLAQPGERVAVDARIVEIVDLSRLELEASLSAADSIAVQVGDTATLTVEGATQPLSAKVVRINPSAVASSRAVLAYLAIDNTPASSGQHLRQGLFAQGSLRYGTARTLALPVSAVRTDKPQPYVQWVANNKVVHQTVTLGARGESADAGPAGVTLVGVQGVPEGTVVLAGSIGTLREGTTVKLAGQ